MRDFGRGLVIAAFLAVTSGCDSSPPVGSVGQAVESGAAVITDKDDYSPGDTALVSGTGWASGEDVLLTVECLCGCHDEIPVTADASGVFADIPYAITEEHFGTTCTLTATGLTSGLSAQTVFTDAPFGYSPVNQSLTVTAGAVAGVSFTQFVTSSGVNPATNATLFVAATGGNPIPDAWVSANPSTLAFPDANNNVVLQWTITFKPPSSAASGTYTADIKANPSAGSVGVGPGTHVTLVVNGSNQAPVTKCKDASVSSSPLACGASASIDDGSFDPDGNTPTCTQSPPGPYGLGDTGVILNCSDGLASTSCSATVTVTDVTDPVLTCPAPPQTECSSHSGATVSFSSSASDNCTSPQSSSCSPASGGVFPLGTTDGTCSAVDGSGNDSTCAFHVVVVDTTAPSVTCVGPQTVECDNGQGGSTVAVGATGADVCATSVTTSCTPGSGVFSVGEHSTTCSADDGHGNSASCQTSVTVQDTRDPTIQCQPPSATECTSAGGALVSFSASATDACYGATAAICGSSGNQFPIGSTPASCTATDPQGNDAACSFDVVVEDTTDPIISCQAAQTLECTSPQGAVATVSATATDTCTVGTITGVCSGSGGTFPLGTTSASCSAEDGHGNSASCETSVTVEDTTAPVLTCPADVTAECNAPGVATGVSAGAASATDLCTGAAVSDPPAGTYPLGTSSATHGAVDGAGNATSCSNTVTVVDTTPPTFDPSTLGPRTILGTCSGGPISFTPPVATDVCQAVTVTCSPLAANSFGSNTVTCTATDDGGNHASANLTVNLVEPLRVAFLQPLSDDNQADDPSGDADAQNLFTVKSTIPHQVKLYACDGADVTSLVSVNVTLTVTMRNGAGGDGTNIVPTFTGVGDAGGTMILVDGKYKYNLKTDPAHYPSGTASNSNFFQSLVTVSYTSAPAIVAGREDARLESR